jgi:hypothetical protein
MPDFDEELLSAYLDGEASPVERARVEQWLAEQPESRQLLEELRSLKTGLERMPRARLPHDFAEQVLRQAEREVLTGRSDGQGGGAAAIQDGDGAEPIDQAERVERVSGFSWQRLRRPVVWASLTLAAGLLLMFIDRRQQPPAAQRQVAMAPPGAAGRDGGEIGARDAEEAPAPLSQAAPPSGAMGPASAEWSRSLSADDGKPAAADKLPGAAPAEDTAHLEDRMAGAKAHAGDVADEAMDEAEDLKRESLAEQDALQSKLTLGRDGKPSLVMPEQTLVVWCDVSPDKKYNERFRQLLTSNSIQWSEEGEPADAALGARRFSDSYEKQDEGKKQPATRKPGKDANVREQFAAPAHPSRGKPESFGTQNFARNERQQRRLLEAGQAAVEENAELVLVEASEPQIEAVLAELDRDDDVFKSVDVEPAEDAPRQQELQRYRRGVAEAGEAAKENAGRRLKKKVAQKAEASPAAPAPTQAAGETKQTSQGGFAYSLRSQMNRVQQPAEGQKQDETRRLDTARGVANQPSGGTDQNRLQVLFVLRPVEDAKPAAAAPAAKENNQDND